MPKLDLSKGKCAEVEGLDELVKTIEALKDKVSGDDLRKVLMRGALTIRDEARDMAPVKTGRLKNSIIATYGKKEPDKDGNINVVVMTKTGENGAPHAHNVEYGHSRAPAHPFMRPALSAAKPTATKQIAEGLQEIIESATEKQ